jgi:hypothetical protein
MSQLDVAQAKQALAARLRDWGTPGDTGSLAAGFIDDLTARGWQMTPFLEARPQPPKVGTACCTCGREYGPACCDNPVQHRTEDDYADGPALARKLLTKVVGGKGEA